MILDSFASASEKAPSPDYLSAEELAPLLQHAESQLSTSRLPAPHHLTVPVCVPQSDPTFHSPFLRAYSPALEASGVSRDEWLTFTDGLNRALNPSVVLQLMDKTGMCIKYIPNPHTVILGLVMQSFARTGIYLTSTVKSYLAKANNLVFRPRGLIVRLIKAPALRPLLTGIAPQPRSALSTVTKSVKVSGERFGIHCPIVRKMIVANASPAPSVSAMAEAPTRAERLVATLHAEGLIAPLAYDVPAPQSFGKLKDKLGSFAVSLRQKKRARQEYWADDARRELAVCERAEDSVGEDETEERETVGRRIRIEQEYYEQNLKRLRTQVRIDDRKEHLAGKRLLWIVFMNLADGDVRPLVEDDREAGRSWKVRVSRKKSI